MPFEKNHKLSPGRTKGSKNRSTISSDKLKDIIENELDKIPELLERLEDEKRLEMIVKLLPYVAPKLSTQQVDLNANVQEVKLPSWMTEGDDEYFENYN
jgi:hypothetical protein